MTSPPASATDAGAPWQGPGAPRPAGLSRWGAFRRSWKFGRQERSRVTLPGTLLVLLTLAIGTAAYNASNNLLFLALSLLLASLILSGILSSLNFLGCSWRFSPMTPARAGLSHTLYVELRNGQRFLPIQGLFAEVLLPGEKTPRRLHQSKRLDPGDLQALACSFTPLRRGRHLVKLTFVGSYFPFGFLRKGLLGRSEAELIVRPPRIEYHVVSRNSLRMVPGTRTVSRPGRSGDLLALRPYRSGDPHREIHWKASARTGRLVVRTFTSEASEKWSLYLESSRSLWPTEESFERFCAFAATLVEDLFRLGRIGSVIIDQDPPRRLSSAREVETLLDLLAVLQPGGQAPRPLHSLALKSLVALRPVDGNLHALLDGQIIASA